MAAAWPSHRTLRAISAGSDSDEAKEIYSALSRELAPDLEIPVDAHRGHTEIASVYTRMLGIAGLPG